MGIEWLRPAAFFGSILFALVGVLVFWLSFLIIDKITPYDLWREIVEKQNKALAMVVAAMSLGISIIVAGALHGGYSHTTPPPPRPYIHPHQTPRRQCGWPSRHCAPCCAAAWPPDTAARRQRGGHSCR